jgi:serine/threonine-protein kinase RIO1
MQDRATVEQALDPRTRLVLFKMLNRGLFSAIHGCVSTGKEANVYYAVNPAGADFAVKVYKTSILVFKDRDRCVPYSRLKHSAAAEYMRKLDVIEHFAPALRPVMAQGCVSESGRIAMRMPAHAFSKT